VIISIEGFKARDLTIRCGKLLNLVGENGAGKSTVTEGLRFLALGWIPALGKRPADTAALMRDREASVRLDLEDGKWCERRIERIGKSLTTSCLASWLADAASQKEHGAAILSLFGDTEESVAEALDLRVLLNTTPNVRASRLTAVLESISDPAATMKLITRYSVQQLGSIAEERMPESIADACPMVPGFSKAGAHRGQYAALKVALGDVTGLVSGEGGLAAALSHAKDQKNLAVADVRTKSAARQELEDRLATLPAANDDELEGLELERAQLEQSIGAQRQRLAEQRRQQQAVADATSQLQLARVNAAAAQDDRRGVERHLADLDAKRGRLAEIDERLAAVVQVPPPDESVADRLQAESDAMFEQAHAIEIPPVVDLLPYDRGIKQLQGQLEAADENPWQRVIGIGDEIVALSPGSTPRVRSLHALAEELHQLAHRNGACDKAKLAAKLKAAETEARRVCGHAGRVDDKRAELGADRVRLETLADEMRAEAKALREQIRRDYAAATQAQRFDAGALRQEKTSLAAAVAAIESRDRRTQERVTETGIELTAAEQRIADLGPVVPADGTTEDDLTPKLAKIQKQIAEAQGAARLREQFNSILAEIETAETSATVWKAVEQACIRTRNEQVAEQGAPLLDRMRVFFAGAGRSEKPFLRAAKGECAIGWERGGKEILVEALSGGEFCIYVAALVAGMLALRDAPLRILLVEGSELDNDNMVALLRGISVVADSLSHCIVCRHAAPSVAVPGWNVLRPGAPDSETKAA
jgi:hypothetical protein